MSSKIPDTEKAIAKFTCFAKNKELGFFQSMQFFVCLLVSLKHARGKKIRTSCEANLGFVLSWSFVDTKWP